MAFNINHMTPVLFGEDTSLQTGEKLEGLGCKKVLAVYDQGVKNAGITDKIIDSIQKQGIEVVTFDGVLADPPNTLIDEAAELGRKENVDGVVGIGGGSTMDTSKAVNLLLNNPGKTKDYLGTGKEWKPGKTLVLIPTTSGTGSEVTMFIVVTDMEDEHKKKGMGTPLARADLAIIDPVLTAGMPPSITADTGMDAYAHAVEAIMGDARNPMSDLLGEEAISLVFKYLPRAVKDGKDMEARTQMSYAAMLAGYSFNDSLTHMGHSLGHTLGSIFHIPHGNACGVAMPEIIEYLGDVVPEPIARIGKAMGLDIKDGASPADTAKAVSDALSAFNKVIGQKTLKELGVKEEDLVKVAQRAYDEKMWERCPKETSPEDMLNILKKAYTR
ncbi:MAG: iron-containing alcohol dehydrogenase [Dehalococcoidales bacterium]|nr:iron-containing alcohol dehydrogenase [Dehalococcoidales bacterium]